MKLLAGVLGLGVAGFDPLGFVALMAAVTLGATKRAVAVLLVTAVSVTFITGVLLSFGLGALVPRLLELVPYRPSSTAWGIGFTVAGVCLMVWGLLRLRAPASSSAKPHGVHVRQASTAAMATTGLLVGISAMIDPPFYAMALLVSNASNVGLRVGLVLTWTLLSHIALVVAAIAILSGALVPLQSLLERLRGRYARYLRPAASVLLMLLGAAGIVAGIVKFTA